MPILPEHCPQCGYFLLKKALCGNCLNNKWFYSSVYAAYPYQGLVEKMITQLKFNHQLIFALALSQLMHERMMDYYQGKPLPQAILPVPLHKKRMQERGFNQALEIARPLARKLQLKLLKNEVIRIIHTLPQSGLNAKNRKQNLKNAFTLVRPVPFQHIAILDDVMTTGETVNALSHVLRENGVKKIDIWCCARRG